MICKDMGSILKGFRVEFVSTPRLARVVGDVPGGPVSFVHNHLVSSLPMTSISRIYILLNTSTTTSSVELLPPRSGVLMRPSARLASTAR